MFNKDYLKYNKDFLPFEGLPRLPVLSIIYCNKTFVALQNTLFVGLLAYILTPSCGRSVRAFGVCVSYTLR